MNAPPPQPSSRPFPDAPPDGLALTDSQRAAVVNFAIRLMAGASVVGLVLLALLPQDHGVRAGGPLLGLATAAGGLYLMRRAGTGIAMLAMIWLFWAAIALSGLLVGGLHAALIVALPALVVIAHMACGRRAAGILLGASIAATAALALAETLHLLPRTAPPPALWSGVVLILVMLVASAVAARLVNMSRSHLGETGRLGLDLASLLVRTSATEASLREQLQTHDTLLGAQALAGVGLFAVAARHIDFANEAMCRLTGHTAAELCELDNFLDLVHPDDRDRTAAIQVAVLRHGEAPPRHDIRILTKRGEVRDIELSLTRQDEGGGTRLIGAMIDISARKAMERELQQSREMFSQAFVSNPLAISITRLADGRVLDINPAYCDMVGWHRDELLGRKLVEFGVWPDVEERTRWAAALLSAGRVRDYPVNTRRRDDTPLIATVTAEILTIGDERCVISFVRDHTELRRTEADLRRSEERFERVFHSSPIATVVTRLSDGTYFDVNAAFTRLLGWERDEAIGRTTVGLGVWESAAERLDWINRIEREGHLREFEVNLHAKNGETRTLSLSAEVVEFAGERCLVSMLVDIGGRKRAEREARLLASELEARVQTRTLELTEANRELESFAYSISHDLRAPLRGIDGFSRLLQEDYADTLDARGLDYLMRVRRAAQRMGTLIDDLLELARVSRQEMKRTRVDLSALAREILAARQQEEPARRVDCRIADDCSAEGDPQLLRVLLENLLGNAWKYTGRVEGACIEFAPETLDEGERAFVIRDNGAGFDMTYAGKLFEPFQRLHSPAEFEGTGVGLASAARVVRRHGGRIWAEGQPGVGATFRFTLEAPPSTAQ